VKVKGDKGDLLSFFYENGERRDRGYAFAFSLMRIEGKEVWRIWHQ
jgi:hypothetical protein